jgi:hypothetical protein
MNYIKHLTAVMEFFERDDRLNPTHISMYMALFQYWNFSRFSESLSISRNEIMSLSKIGSKATYHKCIKELHHYGYLKYFPSHNPFKGSKVMLFNFCPSSEQVLARNSSLNEQAKAHNSSDNEQALVSYKTYINNKQIKHKRQPKKIEEVEFYFSEKKGSSLEAQKFFNYYQSNGWKVGGKTPMRDWKAAARNWIIKANETKIKPAGTAQTQNTDNLKTSVDKNYNEPL